MSHQELKTLWETAGRPMERGMYAASMSPDPKLWVSTVEKSVKGMLLQDAVIHVAEHEFGIRILN